MRTPGPRRDREQSMPLAQGKYWCSNEENGAVTLSVVNEDLEGDLRDLKDLKIVVPLEKWNSVVKYVLTDRKLLGGILLGLASPSDVVSLALASDRVFFELQRVVMEATVCLVGSELLVLAPSEETG